MGLCSSSSAGQNIAKCSAASTSEFISSGAGNSNSSYGTSFVSSNVTGDSRGSGISNFSAASGEDIVSSGHIYPTPSLRVFSFGELKNATRNFKSDTWLGEGGFGKVYKGWIDGRSDRGNLVAIKKLNSESFQGYEEWQAEVDFLGRLSHPNLVKLLGYCYEEKELLLVYEYMPKGSLENHLFGRGSAVQPLSWDVRLKIALGAARAIAFLHTSEKQVIYRDFKASNILLDENYTAKVSDFGLAKLGPSDSRSHVTTRVMGTYGYAAPEYVTTGHLYVKSDVYGYGIVLMEILTGLRALDQTRPSGKQQLVDWIKPYLADRRRLKSVMDCRLGGKYPSKDAHRVARLVLCCAEKEHKNRPSMKQVVETLEQIEGGDKPAKTFQHTHTHGRHSPMYPLPSARRTISDLSPSTEPN